MKSRVHPNYKTKYRVKNWASYDRALVLRGDVTVWLSPAAIATWKPAGVGKRGGQLRYSDVSIETALTLRLLFNLPLRQTEGFLNSLLAMMGLDLSAPDHTTLSRRSQHLDVRLRRIHSGEGIHLIVDSSGLSIVGEGEWAAAKHGGRGKRGWRKLHLGVDGSGVIVAQVLTDGNADDAATVPDLLGRFEGALSGFVADAAYDSRAVYDAAKQRGAVVVVPPTRNATVGGRNVTQRSARDRTVARITEVGDRALSVRFRPSPPRAEKSGSMHTETEQVRVCPGAASGPIRIVRSSPMAGRRQSQWCAKQTVGSNAGSPTASPKVASTIPGSPLAIGSSACVLDRRRSRGALSDGSPSHDR